jgi:hypothetical protein
MGHLGFQVAGLNQRGKRQPNQKRRKKLSDACLLRKSFCHRVFPAVKVLIHVLGISQPAR